ncbi:MAG: hypothetical protein ACPG4T_10005, partial [Nannocystaceae bacterium]
RQNLWIDATALPVFDRFWALKDRVYCDVINRPSNILCEAQLSEVIAQAYTSSIFDAFVEFDDRALEAQLEGPLASSGLRRGRDERYLFIREATTKSVHANKITNGADEKAGGHLARTRKRYYLNRSQQPTDRGLALPNWGLRYCHERQVMRLIPRNPATQLKLPGLAPATSEEPDF